MVESNSLVNIISNNELYKNINEGDLNIIEVKLWTFLGKRIERYTMGDSSSVPIEVAEELFKSLCFSLELLLRDKINSVSILKEQDLDKLLKEAWTIIEEKIKVGKVLLEAVKDTSINIENISYHDTLLEIEESFKRYDYRFLAHNIECSIDYQLANSVSEKLQGIEYINEYLRRLLLENQFCGFFNSDKIINLLNSYCCDYKGLLINIFEPVLTNAIGLILIEEDICALDISKLQRELIMRNLENKSKDNILETLKFASNNICSILKIDDIDKREYIEKTALELYPRIENGLVQGNIENIFLSFKYEKAVHDYMFKDNKNMDNDSLRHLIDEINDCRYLDDKIVIVKNEINSVGDLIEILNECFWDDDVVALLNEYSSDIINVIDKYLEKEGEGFTSNSKWEIKFKEFINK